MHTHKKKPHTQGVVCLTVVRRFLNSTQFDFTNQHKLILQFHVTSAPLHNLTKDAFVQP